MQNEIPDVQTETQLEKTDCLVTKCRELAATGHSRTHAAEILGIERRKFYGVCKDLDVQWPHLNQSRRDRAGQTKRAARMQQGKHV